jgi:hypothetical protein
MPRIPDEFCDSIIFLYPTEEAAQAGENHTEGGCGFLVKISHTNNSNLHHFYLVSCFHVLNKCSFARINNNEKYKVIPIAAQDLVRHTDLDDVAVVPIDITENHKVKALTLEKFLTEEFITQNNIGCGDDVCLIGRFSLHSGKEQNLPSIRFGHISIMPREPVKHPSGLDMEAFVVEMRSRNGYSGSLAIVYALPGTPRPGNTSIVINNEFPFMKILGIDFGHFDSYSCVLNKEKQKLPQ